MTDLVNHGTPSNPGSPVSPSMLNAYLSAVVVAHRLRGHSIDRKSPLIADVWKGIARRAQRRHAGRHWRGKGLGSDGRP
jgi:hypothetical protein